MITSNGNVILQSGDIKGYDTPTIVVAPRLIVRTNEVECALQIFASGGSIQLYEAATVVTKATVDGYTGTGTGDYAKFLNALDQAVKAWLLTLNPSITFTIV